MRHDPHPALPTLAALTVVLAACASTTAREVGHDESLPTPVLPERQPGDRHDRTARPRPLERVDLPALAGTFTSGRAGGPRVRARFVRTPDRMLLETLDATGAVHEAWEFERNPLARGELSGLRADPRSAFLVAYTDSDLRSEGVVDGWSRLAQLFVAPEELDALVPAGETREALGRRFELLVPAGEPAPGALASLWWSAELGLPLRAERRGPDSDLEVLELDTLERAPAAAGSWLAERHPDWELRDLADWREDVHGHVPAAAAAHGHAHQHAHGHGH